MTQIRIDTEHTREVGRRLIAEGDRLAEIGHELHNAIGSLDTWAWDGRSRQRAEPMLCRVGPESAHVAEELDEMGRKLVRVAQVFEQEDNTAAHNLEGMPWVDFSLGASVAVAGVAGATGGAGDAGSFAGGGGMAKGTHDPAHVNVEWKEGSIDTPTSYDLRNKKWEEEKKLGVKVGIVEGAVYDAEDATGDVKVGNIDFGDYKADAKAGAYEAGAQAELGEDGLTFGAYAEATAGEATAEGVIGGSALGLAGAVTAAGPTAGGFVGIRDNTLGASIGGSIISAEAEAGLNIAGANVGVKGGLSLGLEFGFKIGKETEIEFGPFEVGLSFGKAKGK